MTAPSLEVVPVTGMPEVRAGADLGELITAHADLRDGDVLVVASKIVSKAEGAIVEARPDEDPARTRARAVADEAVRIVAYAPWVTIVETHHGFVCANAGVDASNVAGDAVAVLPRDPDDSASRLRADLRERHGLDVGVVISDTFGRPWRTGQTDVALGVSGVPALRSEIGGVDRHGAPLHVTESAIADELAGAADLVRSKDSGVPVVVVRGLQYAPDDRASGRELVRPPETDLFRHGRGGLATALVAEPTRLVGPVDARDLWTLQATVEQVCGAGVRIRRGHARDGRAGTELQIEAGTDVVAGVAAGVLLVLLRDLGYGAVLVETSSTPTVWAGRTADGV